MRTQGQEILRTNMQAIKSVINAVESCPIVWGPEKSVVSTILPHMTLMELRMHGNSGAAYIQTGQSHT